MVWNKFDCRKTSKKDARYYSRDYYCESFSVIFEPIFGHLDLVKLTSLVTRALGKVLIGIVTIPLHVNQ